MAGKKKSSKKKSTKQQTKMKKVAKEWHKFKKDNPHTKKKYTTFVKENI